MQEHFDLIIAGAGLAGNCLALALKDSGLKIAVLEASSQQQLSDSKLGDRALALAKGTVELLDKLGAWQAIADKATAIQHIHVSDQGHFGKTRLSAAQAGVDALGYVIIARDIEQHLSNLVAASDIKVYYQTRVAGVMSGLDTVNVFVKHHEQAYNLTGQLLVGADGGNSTIRKLLEIPQISNDYQQTALVTTVQTTLAHHNTAYERFTNQGPLALLPMAGKQMSVVWTRNHEQAENLLAASNCEFEQALQDCFGYRLGAIQLCAPRHGFPLTLIRAQQMVAGRTVIIGNAAHQLHPVAGQGFNLGIRDVWLLAEQINSLDNTDIGNPQFLASYAEQRLSDHNKTIGFTDNLVKVFSNDTWPLTALRNTGLTLLDHIPAAKQLLTRHAMGFAR